MATPLTDGVTATAQAEEDDSQPINTVLPSVTATGAWLRKGGDLNGEKEAASVDVVCAVDAHSEADESTYSGARVVAPVATRLEEEDEASCHVTVATLQKPVAVAADNASELRALVDEVASVHCVLAKAMDAELISQVRKWEHGHRPPETVSGPREILTAPRLIPMAPPSERSLEARSGDHDPSLLRVVAFENGVYRGQVQRSSVAETPDDDASPLNLPAVEQFLPHGWGIATSRSGQRRVGQWFDGELSGVGSLQSAVLMYDGEWRAAAGPSGYGIGTFTFGATFVGYWHNGWPCGLGRLQSFETGTFEHGWFYGIQCLQPVILSDQDARLGEAKQRCLPDARHDQQPQRGLFLMGVILEHARLTALRGAMEQFRHVACDQALMMARRRRADASVAWAEAHAVEQDAIAAHVARELQAYRHHRANLLEEVAAGRMKHSRLQRTREFHTNRLGAAIFQRELTRRCEAAQEESNLLLEVELADVSALLDEATQAQDECRRLADRQHHVKRQIEQASVKLSSLHHQLDQQRRDGDKYREGTNHNVNLDLPRTHLKTPATPSHARAIHAQRRLGSAPLNGEGSELPFVCDVPGCGCGIPRDVFTRVAAALNGD